MQVDFIIAGAQKCGTTALYKSLLSHPEVCMSIPKEVHFFDNDQLFSQASINYAAYHSHFHPHLSSQILGEATPAYLYWKSSPARIYAYNRDIKLIIILRNPIDRAYSHWNMSTYKGVENLSFREALLAEPDRLKRSEGLQSRPYSYIDRGFYTRQIERYLRYFPRSNLLILRHDDMLINFNHFFEKVCQFLSLSSLVLRDINREHVIPYSKEIELKDWQYLANIFADDISQLETLLDWKCKDWLSPKLLMHNTLD